MYSCGEFHQPAIVRVIAVKGNLNELQTGISLLAGRPTRGSGRWVRGRGGDNWVEQAGDKEARIEINP